MTQIDVSGGAQKDNKDGSSEGSPDGREREFLRTRVKAFNGLEKKFECPQEGCGKRYVKAQSFYRHQLNHLPKKIYNCDFPGCVRSFVRQDLCKRHKDRHSAKGPQLHRKDSTLGHTQASPVTDSIEPWNQQQYQSSETHPGTASSNDADSYLQSNSFKRPNIGSVPQRHESASTTPISRPQRHSSFAHNSPRLAVSQHNFTPFPLSRSIFNTVATSASTRDPEPIYPTSMPTGYHGDSMPQNSGPDMMLLDQMNGPDTVPAFGGGGYSRSPFQIPEDFIAYLFSGQQLPSNSSPIDQTGQQGYESYPYNQDRYYEPYFADEISPGGFLPANQQPHNPMAVTSLLNSTQYEMEIVPPEIKLIPSVGDPLPMLRTHDPDVLFDQENEKNLHQEEQEELARIEQAKQARLAREQAAREEEKRRQREEDQREEQWLNNFFLDSAVSPIGSLIWDSAWDSAIRVEDWRIHDTRKVNEDPNEGTITDSRSNDLVSHSVHDLLLKEGLELLQEMNLEAAASPIDQVDTQRKDADDSTSQITITEEWPQNGEVKSPSNIIRQGTPSDAWPRGYDEGEEPIPANRQLLGTSYKAPFTDSGYASLPNLNHFSHIPSSLEKSQFPANTEPSTTIDDIDREDSRTAYSATTTVGPAHTQIYIAELCSDICSKLGPSFDAKLWSTLSGALPGLIKAFAIKIGYDSSAQVNQDIMYFIHKRHEDVITQLKAIFHHQDDDESDSCRDGHEGMSLRDKMSMWEDKAVGDDLVVENGDLYQGVEDDEDEIIDGVDLLSYRNTILNSAAYKWLLASLRKESSLQWSTTHPRAMIEGIRLRILDKLPTGTISKRRALNVYEVKFDLQWGTGIEGRLGDELLDRLEIPGRSFAEFVTVTGSPEEAQALTVKEYLSQTWPGSGLQLLDILQKTIDHYGHQYSVKLPDNTQLEARISGSRLILTATGPAHFIAECGEQLAWLRAALLGSSRRFIVYCTPSITTYWVDPISSISEKPKYKGHCSIGFDISHMANRCDSTSRVQNCWQALVGESVVILGFPIARRLEACPGLELSFHRLLCFLEAKNATIANGRVLLKGPERALQLMKHSDNVFFWHPLHTPDEVCSCCMDRHIKINVGIPSSPIDSILTAGRHILNNCADLMTPISDNISPSRIFEKPSLSRATFAQHHVLTKTNPLDSPRNLSHNQTATDLNGSLSVLHPHENDESVSRPLITSGDIRSAPEDYLLSFHTEHWGSHSSSNDQNTPTVNSQSADESLDSDLLSISDYSEQLEPLDSNEPAYSFLNTLLQRLLSGFQSTTQSQLSPRGNGESSVTRAPATRSSPTAGTPSQCRKRGRDETNDDDASQDGFPKPPRKKINPGQGKAPQRSLACPYLKFDPIKHRSCCAKQLSRIRDVKQHLSRRHTPERYCQRCLETNFLDERSLDSHINLNTCPLKDRALLEGLSHQQQRQLSHKSNPNLSEEDQWFAIWEITFPRTLFPGLRRPISAYMDTGLSMDMRLFREYCSNHGPPTLMGQIESDPAWSRSEITTEQRRVYLDRVIVQGLNSLFEGYLRSNISSDSAPPSRQNRNIMHPTPTPTDSIADSGVALESQLSPGEASYQEGLLDQLPSTGRLGYQPTLVDDRVQSNSTIQESAVEPSQTHRENLLDMNPPDMYPPDTSFDFSHYDFGSPTFASDPLQYFQDQ